MRLIRMIFRLVFSFVFLFAVAGFGEALAWILKSPSVFFSGIQIYLAAGFAAYFPLHFLFRKYIIFHIFGHELTHALWALLFGGRVEEIYASQRAGGFVTYTRENFLILLAPYFFPLYAICFTLLFHVSKSPYNKIFLFLMGFSLGFHLLLTMWSIRIGQSDIRRSGTLFSLTFIVLMNVLVFGILLCSVHSDYSVMDFLAKGVSLLETNAKTLLKLLPR